MRNKKGKMKSIVFGTTLTMALSLLPQTTFAEEAAETAKDRAVQEVQQKNEDISTIKVTVKDTKAKKTEEKPEGQEDYVVTHSSTGSKIDVETKYIPQSIAVVGQKVIEEQGSKTLEDALSNIAGVTYQSTAGPDRTGGQNSQFLIRGLGAQIVTDGIPDSDNSGWLGNVEKVEVLKGPSSVLYGSDSTGGVINIVTKKPLSEESLTVGQAFGSWGTKDTSLDLSVPLTKDKKWLSRVIVEQEDKKFFQKGLDSKQFNGSIAIQGKTDAATVYTVEAVFHDYDTPGGMVGLIPYNYINTPVTLASVGIQLPYDANYTNPHYRGYYIGRSILGKVEHKVNDTWTINSAVKYSTNHGDYSGLNANTLVQGLPGLFASYFQSKSQGDTLAVETNGNAKFKAWGLQHNAVVGVNWSRANSETQSITGNFATFAFVDLFDPVFPEISSFSAGSVSRAATYNKNLYLSDIIDLSSKLKLAVGFSHNQNETVSFTGGQSYATQGNTRRAGLTYETTPGTTWFLGYSTSYSPNGIGKDINNNDITLPPTTGVQVEGGVKLDISKRANVTVSLYNIDYKDIVNSTKINGIDVATLGGKQNHRGFDIDAQYVIKPGWNILLSYSHLNAEVTANEAYPQYVGKRPGETAENTLKLWSTYEFQEGSKKGLGFGGGLTYVGSRPTTDENIAWMDGYTTLDAVVYYKQKDWSYRLNLYNLTDKKYWKGGNTLGVYAGTSRSFDFTIERKF